MQRYEYNKEERAVLERSRVPFAIYQLIEKRVVTLVISDGFCRLFGYEDREQAVSDMDNNMYEEVHPDDAARVADAAYVFATRGGIYETIYRTKTKVSKEYRVIHAVGEHFLTETGVQLAQVWYTDEGAFDQEKNESDSDIYQIPSGSFSSDNFIRASYYDYLTGLPSMTYFFELADAGCHAIKERGGAPAVLFMDLSGMKYFNHNHGFVEGDKMLRAFSSLLIKYFSNENCSRFGQDHFTVFTEEAGLEETLHAFFKEWQSCPACKTLPVRVGIYLIGADEINISHACDCAKLASDTLRNTVVSAISFYDRSLQEDVEKQHYIISHLDEALENRWVTVYYQPIVRTMNGQVCDEEALARWIDPVRGFLSPGDFIPILEEARIIYKLDLYVLDRVIEKILEFKRRGIHGVRQSVNLSRTDFETCDIVSEVYMRMDAAGLSHDLLTIEITESIIGSNFEFMKKQVDRFRRLGFQVWMDDFGSGYSSLDVLQSLEFDLIKFDMRFLQDLERNKNAKVLMAELMRMATALGIETVCEGVETAEHVRFLKEIGCAKLQGYYYSKPIPLEDFFRRHDNGEGIGFENPLESDYFDSIGRINLYDLSVIAKEGETDFKHYFNNIPMAILEIKDEVMYITRYNESYRDLFERCFEKKLEGRKVDMSFMSAEMRSSFLECFAQDMDDTKPTLIDETLPDGSVAHSYFRKIARNPMDDTVAIVFVVLAVTKADKNPSIEDIARALAVDYICLYQVDLNTGEFAEYASAVGESTLSHMQNGENFFEKTRRIAGRQLYRADREGFKAAFQKDKVLNAVDKYGVFNLVFRIMEGREPEYVHLKAIRMKNDAEHLFVGISSIDAQMKQKESRERMERAQALFSLINTLEGEFICVFTVDPKTGHYTENRSSKTKGSLSVTKEGDDFFSDSLVFMKTNVLKDDWDLFRGGLKRDTVLSEIAEKGRYRLRYRMAVKKIITEVEFKAVMVRYPEGDRLLIGVKKADA
ncbi:MAG: GGDEF domain-containing phosphodiesterase [Lachnospiraceae bacterium]|nr:GGDEF domain-containing phosphodiesterase [Lachnospiraceae bacterium]